MLLSSLHSSLSKQLEIYMHLNPPESEQLHHLAGRVTFNNPHTNTQANADKTVIVTPMQECSKFKCSKCLQSLIYT